MKKIYLASSWRNSYQEKLVKTLRQAAMYLLGTGCAISDEGLLTALELL